MRPPRRFGWFLLVALLGPLVACTPTPRTARIAPDDSAAFFPFVRDRVTRRDEVLLRLGEPVSSYESGRILVYWLKRDAQGGIEMTGAYLPDYGDTGVGGLATKEGIHNLVLVFGPDDVLVRHSLVFVR